ncbi:TetR/AcrR family transcriptional regulator [Exilibacterium tricleocarpae]|uniref:TetR/AcrR family transcriptional regulator n=1 Tax=Exilibacterium tricleocarpae TaxID=2591008 RepID=A0A545TVP2_9GAMM|nr:TetR/AcrR family transcriptional regulator [Exilibacterium tricleocarpae]TQV81272.1 TetR/AcrR family transcriptional regulator [Exilibacterium tricleocarpae]
MDKTKQKVQKFREREQNILDAALKLLIERGEEKVTVEQIADYVDIGKGTIYKHFTSKVEIYLRLLFDYERSIAERLKEGVKAAEEGDPAAPARAYFECRISNPEKDRLFQRLEEKIIALNQAPEKMEELHQLRNSIEDGLKNFISRRIAEGRLQDVPPYFYYAAYWALTQGAVELYHSKSFSPLVEDMKGLMDFIKDIGVHMGNQEDRS